MAKGKYLDWLAPERLALLKGWAMRGLTDADIGKNVGVRASTLCEWKNRFPEIAEALKKGKEVADIAVENALYKRAIGYEYDEVMTEESEDGYKRRVTRKMVVPDVTAQIFWLKNRRPDLWRNSPEYRSDEVSKVALIMKRMDDEAGAGNEK